MKLVCLSLCDTIGDSKNSFVVVKDNAPIVDITWPTSHPKAVYSSLTVSGEILDKVRPLLETGSFQILLENNKYIQAVPGCGMAGVVVARGSDVVKFQIGCGMAGAVVARGSDVARGVRKSENFGNQKTQRKESHIFFYWGMKLLHFSQSQSFSRRFLIFLDSLDFICLTKKSEKLKTMEEQPKLGKHSTTKITLHDSQDFLSSLGF